MRRDRRISLRKDLESLIVEELTLCSSYEIVAARGELQAASIENFVIRFAREDLLSPEHRSSLNLSFLVGEPVALYLPQMNLDLDGTITHIRHLGRGQFDFVISYSEGVPEYWRESLVTLLPAPGEIKN